MAANTNPIFTDSPSTSPVRFATANTNRDGTGTIATLFTPGADGSMLERVQIKATSPTTAGMLRLYVHDGSSWRLLDEIPVTAITPSGTVASFEALWTPPGGVPLTLQSGRTIGISTHNAESFDATAIGGDF